MPITVTLPEIDRWTQAALDHAERLARREHIVVNVYRSPGGVHYVRPACGDKPTGADCIATINPIKEN